MPCFEAVVYTDPRMSPELDKICAMLAEGSAELQCAAAMVLGELKSRDAAVRKALARALQSANDTVRLYAVEALAGIDAEEAVPHLIPLLGAAPALKARAMKVIEQAGPEVLKTLREKLKDAETEVRRGIVEALGHLEKENATDLLLRALQDRDPAVAAQTVSSFQNVVRGMTEAARKTASKKVVAFLKSGGLAVPCVQVLGALRDASALKVLMRFLDRKHPMEVRSAALSALAQFRTFGAGAKSMTPKLLSMLEENELTVPAVAVLERIKVDSRRVLRLVGHAHSVVRTYALRALGTVGKSEAVEPLIAALGSSDRETADAAAAALRSNPASVPLLVRAMEAQTDSAQAWKIADILRTMPGGLDPKTRKQLLSRFLELLEKREERYRLPFEVLRSIAMGDLRAALLRRGREATSKKKLDLAEYCLRLLEPDDLATAESEYALATVRLKQRRNDPAILLFGKLLRREGFPLVRQLEKDARAFAPGDLLHLGFRLIERQGADRDFGAAVLQIVTKRFPSSSEARIAKQKLKTQGIG